MTLFSKDAPDVGGFGELLRFDNLTCLLGYVAKRPGRPVDHRRARRRQGDLLDAAGS